MTVATYGSTSCWRATWVTDWACREHESKTTTSFLIYTPSLVRGLWNINISISWNINISISSDPEFHRSMTLSHGYSLLIDWNQFKTLVFDTHLSTCCFPMSLFWYVQCLRFADLNSRCFSISCWNQQRVAFRCLDKRGFWCNSSEGQTSASLHPYINPVPMRNSQYHQPRSNERRSTKRNLWVQIFPVRIRYTRYHIPAAARKSILIIVI